MLNIYIGCFVFGTVYAVLSALLGSHGLDHSGMEHGGPEHLGMDHAGMDPTGVHTGGGHSADSHGFPSPFNPLVVASAITAFGALGIIGRLAFGLGDAANALFAAGSAAVVGAVMFFGVVKFMYSSQSNTSFSEEELIGLEAEIITPIPENGIGEIAYIEKGTRYTCPARSLGGEKIKKGERVKIAQISGRIPEVIRKIGVEDLDSIELMQEQMCESASFGDTNPAEASFQDAPAEAERSHDEANTKLKKQIKED